MTLSSEARAEGSAWSVPGAAPTSCFRRGARRRRFVSFVGLRRAIDGVLPVGAGCIALLPVDGKGESPSSKARGFSERSAKGLRRLKFACIQTCSNVHGVDVKFTIS